MTTTTQQISTQSENNAAPSAAGESTSRETRQREATERLEAGVRSIQGSETFKAFLRLAVKFHNYSWRNWMMIFIQKPDACRVAGYRAWQALGRQVRKGEKGLKILAPLIQKKRQDDEVRGDRIVGFRTVTVFDISQTEGDELPTVPVPVLTGDAGAELYRALASVACKEGIHLIDDAAIDRGAAGYWHPANREIHIDATLSQTQRVKTLAHELGHALCNHGGKGDTSSAAEAETIAESIAFIVCDSWGIDTSERSFPYVARFAQRFETFARVLDDVRRISALILDVARVVEVA